MAMEGEVGPDEADPHAGGEADADVDPRPGVDSADEEPGEAVEGEDDRVAGAALMCEFVRQAVARKSTHPQAYKSLKQNVFERVNGGDNEDVAKWLLALSQCVSSLEPSATKDLVLILLRIDWFTASDDVLDLLSEFVTALVSAHSVYAEICMVQIIRNFVGGGKPRGSAAMSEEEVEEAVAESDRILEEHVMPRACSLLFDVLVIVPSQVEQLVRVLERNVPHVRCESRIHWNYARSLLRFCELEPRELSPLVMPVLINLVLQVDIDTGDITPEYVDDAEAGEYDEEDDDAASATSGMDETQFEFEEEFAEGEGDVTDGEESPEAVEEMEEDLDPAFAVGEKLDVLMLDSFDFIRKVAEADLEHGAEALFDVFYKAFEHRILQTYQTKHVQYVLFYVCSLAPSLPQHFVVQLLDRAADESTPQLQRQTAMAYVGSFLARARFASLDLVQAVLATLTESAVDYARDHHRPSQDPSCLVFYARCQAIFYIMCFRLGELMAMDGGATFIGTLQLDTIVGSSLCPLQVCQKDVVRQFTKVTKGHEVVYCAQYMRRRRSVLSAQIEGFHRGLHDGIVPAHQLENFFPFDPYLLPRSAEYIKDLYKVWTPEPELEATAEADTDSEQEDAGENDEDDFLPGLSSSIDSLGSSGSNPTPGRAGSGSQQAPRAVPIKKRMKGVVGNAMAGFIGSPISPFSPASLGHTKKR